MKYLNFIIVAVLLASCSDSFVNHELKFEKFGDCRTMETPIGIESNINGERYQFEQCMDDGFTGKEYTVERRADSIFVNFPKSGAKQGRFKITIDIDAKPAYHYIAFDGRAVLVHSSEK
jgi:hypothetical protein